MKRCVLALGGILLLVTTIATVRASSMDRLAGRATRTAPIAARTQIIAGHECQAHAVDGKVRICHATGSGYNLLDVSVEACSAGHGGHEKDTIAPPSGGCEF